MEYVYQSFQSQKRPIVVREEYEQILEDQQQLERGKGLSPYLVAVFIVADMAGTGILAVPRAVADAGWGGIALVFLCCGVTLYAGICLGRCWSILEERYDEYKQKHRFPYPAIAQRAMGVRWRCFASVCIDVNLFGVATVFLLLSAQFMSSVAGGLPFCWWILVLAVLLCPLMWLATPEDFWFAAVVAMSSILAACSIIVILLAEQLPPPPSTRYPPPTGRSFFLAFGTVLFAFGAAPAFPTYQNDMKNRGHFTRAAVIGFGVCLLLYLPVGVLGYVVYGDSLPADIISPLPHSVSKSAISILLATQLFFAFLLIINPAVQHLEEVLKVPKRFGWKRCGLRTAVLVAVVFVGLSIPKFGKVLNLVGSSTTTLTATVFPCLFYHRLCSQQTRGWPSRLIPLYEKAGLILIVLCGLIGGSISTYSAVLDIVQPDSFSPPCYINMTTNFVGYFI